MDISKSVRFSEAEMLAIERGMKKEAVGFNQYLRKLVAQGIVVQSPDGGKVITDSLAGKSKSLVRESIESAMHDPIKEREDWNFITGITGKELARS